jgi:AcrR family transcriptional regulator
VSISIAQPRASKTRTYRLGKRADRQLATRRRIVEATVELHSTLGPARTSVSQIAERAGVQRHTFYAHFPDERGLFLACSGLALERDPLPDVVQLKVVPAGRERLGLGLELFYGWFDRNKQQAGCVLRDAEHHALTREMVELRMKPIFDQAQEVLGEGLGEPALALLAVALDFHCWRQLSVRLAPAAAAALMSDAIAALGGADR